jgi:SAM-dependent methyltransferase
MATAITTPETPDFTAIKQRQQATWASGDYSIIGGRLVSVAENLCEAADLRTGWRVLDVATGAGNAAIAAARHGCDAVGVDYVPELLERSRERAEAERLPVAFVEGDAEALPFPDDSFDAVTSVYGVMFAPDHQTAASELVRVCRPGGTIALASWTPEGFLGQFFRTLGRHVPPPAGVPSPMMWGSEPHLCGLFGDAITSLEVTERAYTFRFASPEQHIAVFREWYGPTVRAFAALDEDGQRALEADLVDLVRAQNRVGDGGTAVPATYVEAVATTR